MEQKIEDLLRHYDLKEWQIEDLKKKLLNLHSVSKCHDSGHNTYIDYDGECGACGCKEKE